MNLQAFLAFLAVVWIIGGVLVLPFNSAVLGGVLAAVYDIPEDRWWAVSRWVWAVQMVWNFIFALIGIFLGHIEANAIQSKITYTLTRGRQENWGIGEGKYAIYHWNPDVWDWRFYRETAAGLVAIDDYAGDATPFQKATHDTSLVFEGEKDPGLEIKGLHLDPNGRQDTVARLVAFDELPYEEAIAYIDAYNAAHSTDPAHEDYPGQSFLAALIFAVVTPFFWFTMECIGIGSIVFIICSPLLALGVFGPSVYGLWKAGAFDV
jgi:hypothetical protein